MPPRSRLIKFISGIKKGRNDSRPTDFAVVGSHGADDLPLVPINSEQQQGNSPLPVKHVEEGNHSESRAISVDPRAEGESSKKLMAIDAAIEILSIMKEASEASSVLKPLKTTCSVTLKLLEAARVSSESSGTLNSYSLPISRTRPWTYRLSMSL